jgi:DNA-binding transcriptional regulator YiaG
MKRKTKKSSIGSQIVSGLQELVETMKRGEPVEKRFTCRTVVLNLEPANYDAKLVKKTRRLLQTSQAVFAQLLGTSVKTVSAWEQGANVPSDMARRFMDEIRRNPDYWRGRIRESAVAKEPRSVA